MRSVLRTTVFALLVLGCASEGDPSTSDDDGSGGDEAATGARGSSSASSAAQGAGPGVGGTGASSSASSTGSGTGGGAPNVLFPLGAGYSWTYDVAPVGGGVVCSPGVHDATVVSSGAHDGRDAFEVTGWCSGAGGTSWVAPGTGDEVFYDYGGDWLTLLSVPVEEGHSWPYFNTSFTWHAEPPVTVPAGTFDDCWTAQQDVAYTAFTTYCRGVGAVRSYSSDLNGQGWDAKLSSYSF